jgi:hypothetical protein
MSSSNPFEVEGSSIHGGVELEPSSTYPTLVLVIFGDLQTITFLEGILP